MASPWDLVQENVVAHHTIYSDSETSCESLPLDKSVQTSPSLLPGTYLGLPGTGLGLPISSPLILPPPGFSLPSSSWSTPQFQSNAPWQIPVPNQLLQGQSFPAQQPVANQTMDNQRQMLPGKPVQQPVANQTVDNQRQIAPVDADEWTYTNWTAKQDSGEKPVYLQIVPGEWDPWCRLCLMLNFFSFVSIL